MMTTSVSALPILALGALCAANLSPFSQSAPASNAPPAVVQQPCEPVLPDLGHLFAGTDPVAWTLVLMDDATGCNRIWNPVRARMRFRPASTFKIPNSLIALETGVASGPGFTLAWDSLAHSTSRRSWARDQTLTSAFRNSVYWYYQELARRVGEVRMRSWLDRLEYGNSDMGGGLDSFWLEGDLRISPEEQVRFLQRLRRGELPVSERSRTTVIELMRLKERGDFRLFGKTGSSDVTATRENGWIVGWVEREGGIEYYALNLEGESVWEDFPPQRRADLIEEILRLVQGRAGGGTDQREGAATPGIRARRSEMGSGARPPPISSLLGPDTLTVHPRPRRKRGKGGMEDGEP